MPATISSSGTWTTIAGLVGMDAKANVPSINNISLEDLKTIHGVEHPETEAFIQLFADAYSLTFWQAAGALDVVLKGILNSEGPRQQRSYTP